MAKKSKDQRIQVILECTEQKTSGIPGMSRYVTKKNKKNTPERLELKKFNPYAKKVVAAFQSATGKDFTKVILMVKSEKSGAYVFKESIVPNDQVKDVLAGSNT